MILFFNQKIIMEQEHSEFVLLTDEEISQLKPYRQGYKNTEEEVDNDEAEDEVDNDEAEDEVEEGGSEDEVEEGGSEEEVDNDEAEDEVEEGEFEKPTGDFYVCRCSETLIQGFIGIFVVQLVTLGFLVFT